MLDISPARAVGSHQTSMGKAGSGELVQGTLPLLILRTLAPGPNHGFAIARRIQQVSNDILRVEEGSLYPALHRLEVQGWVAAEWRLTENNRNAKYYRLTREGRKQLEREATRWNAIADAIAAVLREA
jgi:PadR family transcriptional regulator, regulatory protein PadR